MSDFPVNMAYDEVVFIYDDHKEDKSGFCPVCGVFAPCLVMTLVQDLLQLYSLTATLIGKLDEAGIDSEMAVGWVIIDTDTEDPVAPAHVMPTNDLVEHTLDEGCACGPDTKPIDREDGSVGWVIEHHALDGRG